MELTLFQIGKKTILSQKIQYLLHGFHVTLVFIFGINEDVIQINNNKNIELFSQKLIDVALEASQSVG